jgi:YVTN family beta-propeller protein
MDGIPVDGSVSVIDLSTNTVVDTVPVAGGPNWVTVTDRPREVQKKPD